jgi:hypothetical protein
MGRPQCRELLQALLAHAQDDPHSRVGVLMRSLGAKWQSTDQGASIVVLLDDADDSHDVDGPRSGGGRTTNVSIPLICRPCAWTGQESKVRAFVTDNPMTMVFCNGRCENDLETILVHELTHLFDVHRLHLNLRECHDLAYSEIRAAKFAECHRQHDRSPVVDGTSSNHHHTTTNGNDVAKVAKCIRRRAQAATSMAMPQQEPQAVKSCIEDAYHRAMRDNRPFA